MYRRLPTSMLQLLARAEQKVVLARPLSLGFARQFVSVVRPSCSPFCVEQTRSYSLVQKQGQPKVPKEMSKKEVQEKVLHAVKSWDRFPSDRLEKLSLEARFVEDLGFDSLDHVEIVMAVEEEFGREIPDEKAEKLKTPNDVVAFICEEEDILE